MHKGVAYAVGAYALWGLLPLYWRALGSVPALEILAHRVVWALIVALLLLAYRRSGWGWLRETLHRPRQLAAFALSALLLSANWFLYIWAVHAGHVVETSLGNFIWLALAIYSVDGAVQSSRAARARASASA
ncbi:MAG: hypothetical protein OHK0015_01250 [Chloroflexi bacterium OHK40]